MSNQKSLNYCKEELERLSKEAKEVLSCLESLGDSEKMDFDSESFCLLLEIGSLACCLISSSVGISAAITNKKLIACEEYSGS